MKIVIDNETYLVHEESYGYCKKCGTYWDSWRIAEGFICPNCLTALDKLSYHEIKDMLVECIANGCLKEEYAYPVPLKPVSSHHGKPREQPISSS